MGLWNKVKAVDKKLEPVNKVADGKIGGWFLIVMAAVCVYGVFARNFTSDQNIFLLVVAAILFFLGRRQVKAK